MKNTIMLKDGIRYVSIISKRFLCPRCNIFCMELTPVYTRFMLRRLRVQKRMPTTKIFCKNGCHERPDWSFDEFSFERLRDRNRVAEWPEEWKKNAKRRGK